MQITVKVKNVYGVDRIYPVCEKAKLFLELTGNKTFSGLDIETIKRLGFEVLTETPTI